MAEKITEGKNAEMSETDNSVETGFDPDFATKITPDPEGLPEDVPIGVDPDNVSAEETVAAFPKKGKGKNAKKEASATDAKPVKKGSLFCFVAVFMIAVSVAAAMICMFTTKDMTVMTDVIGIIVLVPQVIAYAYMSFPALAWASHRKQGVKIAFFIAVVIIFACLATQLGLYINDIIAQSAKK